jgi:chloramphenicol 3-O phosphotransferase
LVDLIAITGPAAAGKSTVARAVQAELARRGELWIVHELDLFGRGLSREWIAMGSHRGAHADRGFVYARAADGSIALELGPDGRRVLAAFHRSVAAVARSGLGIVCETIVYDDEDWRDWCAALEGVASCWVRLGAPLATLAERERADRTRLLQGLARGMSARPPAGRFDVEADTAAEAPDEIVARILAGRFAALRGEQSQRRP